MSACRGMPCPLALSRLVGSRGICGQLEVGCLRLPHRITAFSQPQGRRFLTRISTQLQELQTHRGGVGIGTSRLVGSSDVPNSPVTPRGNNGGRSPDFQQDEVDHDKNDNMTADTTGGLPMRTAQPTVGRQPFKPRKEQDAAWRKKAEARRETKRLKQRERRAKFLLKKELHQKGLKPEVAMKAYKERLAAASPEEAMETWRERMAASLPRKDEDGIKALKETPEEHGKEIDEPDHLQDEHLNEALHEASEISGSDDTTQGAHHVRLNKSNDSNPSAKELGALAKRTPYQDANVRIQRAAHLAQSMESARAKQATGPSDVVTTRTGAPLVPGMGQGYLPGIVRFEMTEIIYPPSDIYPPPLPVVREVDPTNAARALGVLRSSEVEWDSKARVWRKTTRPNEWYEQNGLVDLMDNEQALEYLGDSVLHLLSRSLLHDHFPGKTVSALNLASAWLVSNDCFAYMYEDSRLEEERVRLAHMMSAASKKRELERAIDLTDQELKAREEAPLPAPILPAISHLRQADLLEAYVGASYLTFGFATTAKWCTVLLTPWLDLIDRTPEFQHSRYLSAAGEVQRRAQMREQVKREEAERRSRTWWGRLKRHFFK